MSKAIFLSYSRSDRQFADQIAAALHQAGFEVWLDRQSLPAGELWLNHIRQAIARCAAVVVLVSRESLRSEMVAQELLLAEQHRVSVIPVAIEGRGAPLGRFQSVHCIDFAEQPFSNAIAQLCQALNSISMAERFAFDFGPSHPPAPSLQQSQALAPLMNGRWTGHMADSNGAWDLDIVLADLGRFQGFYLRPGSFETVTVIGSWRVEEPRQLKLEGTATVVLYPPSPWTVAFFFVKISPTLLEGFTLPERAACVWRRQ